MSVRSLPAGTIRSRYATFLPEPFKFSFVGAGQLRIVPDDQSILSVSLVGVDRKIERAGLCGIPIHNHEFVVHDGVVAIEAGRNIMLLHRNNFGIFTVLVILLICDYADMHASLSCLNESLCNLLTRE